MQNELIYLANDSRVSQAKKILESVIGSAERKSCKVMITRDNTLVIIVMDTAIYMSKLINVEYGEVIAFDYFKSSTLEENEFLMDKTLIPIIEYIYILYIEIINNPEKLLAFDNELRGNIEIERLIGLKSADGCNFYKLYGKNINEIYYFPFFSGFPNISKPDKLGFEVYRFDNTHCVNVMNIFKKKINREVKVIYRVINLGGN